MKAVKTFESLGDLYLDAKQKETVKDVESFLMSRIKERPIFETTLYGLATVEKYPEEEVTDGLAILVANGKITTNKTWQSGKPIVTYQLAKNNLTNSDVELDASINGNSISKLATTSLTDSVVPDSSMSYSWLNYVIWFSCHGQPASSLYSVINKVMLYKDTFYKLSVIAIDSLEITEEVVRKQVLYLRSKKWFMVNNGLAGIELYKFNPVVTEPKVISVKLLELKRDLLNIQKTLQEKSMSNEQNSNLDLPIEQVKEWVEFAIWYILNKNSKMNIGDLSRAVFSLIPFKTTSYWNQAKIADKVVMLVKRKYVKTRVQSSGGLALYSLGSFPKPLLTFVNLINEFNKATGSNMTLPVPKYCEKLSDPKPEEVTQSQDQDLFTETKVTEPLSKEDSVNQAIWKIVCDRQWYTVEDVAVLLETIGVSGSTPSARMSHLWKNEGWFDREIKQGSKVYSYRLKEGIEYPPRINVAKKPAVLSETRAKINQAIKGTSPEVVADIAKVGTNEFKLEDLGPGVASLIAPKEDMSEEEQQRHQSAFLAASLGASEVNPSLGLSNVPKFQNTGKGFAFTDNHSILKPSMYSVPLIDIKTTVKGVVLSKEEVTQLVSEAALLIQTLESCNLLNVKVELKDNYLSLNELKEIVKALG